MKQDAFVKRHAGDWDRFERWLAQAGLKQPPETVQQEAPDIPHLYRRLCHHLALARSRHYSAHLVDRLERLVLAGHQRLYQARRASLAAVAEFVGRRFPARVRAEWRLVLLAALVFYVPLAGTFAAAWHDPDFVYSLMAPEQVARFELMYSDEGQKKLGRLRASDDDFAMFGFYIRNNIGIGFQTFAGGVFAGLGSLFFLAANGLFIGVVGGHLVQAGHAENFFSFVAGHSALELTAIVLCGAAGLRLGAALVRPGPLSRRDALRLAARPSLEMVYGAALMLVGAAFIEAFWSSTQAIPPAVKYGVGLAGWGVLLLYFLLAGRGRAA